MRRVSPHPTAERVRALVRYDGENFYWLPRPVSAFVDYGAWRSWATRCEGKPVKVKACPKGYLSIRVDGRIVQVHRAIWLFHYGDWPKHEIDHINGDPSDNRIENLRDVPRNINARNRRVRSDSSSGFPGVHHHSRNTRRPWIAQISVDGRNHHLGCFATKEEAIACRQREQRKHGFTERHGEAA